ncbi:MAG: prepilin-type N-terminal cleavage/methylation domain-containing protein [Shewanellaceae bacterium]|nr:prepilin-type N-terminal cleavage/methylation domain-containing protein [Shewanellaceae bacterium]
MVIKEVMVRCSTLPKGFSLLELSLVILILSTLSVYVGLSSDSVQSYVAHLKRETLISHLEDALQQVTLRVTIGGTQQDAHGNQYLPVFNHKIPMVAGHIRMLNSHDAADHVNLLVLIAKPLYQYTVPSAMLDHQRIQTASFTSPGKSLMLAVANACFVRISSDRSHPQRISFERYPRETC